MNEKLNKSAKFLQMLKWQATVKSNNITLTTELCCCCTSINNGDDNN